MQKVISLFKKILHRHKYTTLSMYGPRPQYNTLEWGFLVRCDCGHCKLTKLPGTIKIVECVKDDV
jgi:hypothetical protein